MCITFCLNLMINLGLEMKLDSRYSPKTRRSLPRRMTLICQPVFSGNARNESCPASGDLASMDQSYQGRSYTFKRPSLGASSIMSTDLFSPSV